MDTIVTAHPMWKYEKYFWSRGFNHLAGVDEAGRGPLAGPVFAAAVIFPLKTYVHGIKDSKKMSALQREEFFKVICEKAECFGIGMASEDEIDLLNIHQASFLAMKRALRGLSSQTDMVLVDGFSIPDACCEQYPMIRGDNKSASIAAASILAKVSRDYYMLALDSAFPHYEFKKHKGYATELHLQKLKQFGPSPVHRMSFSPCTATRDSGLGSRDSGRKNTNPGSRIPVLSG